MRRNPVLHRPAVMLRQTFKWLTYAAVALVAPALAQSDVDGHSGKATVSVSVFVNSGLNNPRGLRFGPDGDLYVAEGGTGGTTSTTDAQSPWA